MKQANLKRENLVAWLAAAQGTADTSCQVEVQGQPEQAACVVRVGPWLCPVH